MLLDNPNRCKIVLKLIEALGEHLSRKLFLAHCKLFDSTGASDDWFSSFLGRGIVRIGIVAPRSMPAKKVWVTLVDCPG
jgi:hypothetical protein